MGLLLPLNSEERKNTLSFPHGSSELRLKTASDETYFLQSSPDLSTWSFETNYEIGDGSEASQSVSDTLTPLFYRYAVYPTNVDNPHDTDGDGLLNDTELKFPNSEYHPGVADTDNNGVNDGEEDFDNDGHNNKNEQDGGSKPNDPLSTPDQTFYEDFDNDGLKFWEEILANTDLMNPDSDNDGIPDGKDGWPLCPLLSPERNDSTTYVFVDFAKNISDDERITFFDLNNKGQSILKVQKINEPTSPKKIYFINGNIYELPTGAISKLNENGFFLIDNNLYFEGSLVDTIKPELDLLSVHPEPFCEFLSSADDCRKVFIQTILRHNNTVWGLHHSETTYNIINLFNSQERMLVNMSTKSALNPSIIADTTFSLSYIESPGFIEPRGGTLFQPEQENKNGVSLSQRISVIDFGPENHITNPDYSGEHYTDYGVLHNDTFTKLLDKIEIRNNEIEYERQPVTQSHINNKNVIQLTQKIDDKSYYHMWFDQSYTNTLDAAPNLSSPNLKKIDWSYKWGPRPPLNLNAKMQGFQVVEDNEGVLIHSNRLWNNAIWELISAQGCYDIKIFDINDYGVLAISCKNFNNNSTENSTGILLPVELLPNPVPLEGVARMKLNLSGGDFPDLGESSMPTITIGGEVCEDVVQDKETLSTFYFTPPAFTSAGKKDLVISGITVPNYPKLSQGESLEMEDIVEYTDDTEDGLRGIFDSMLVCMDEAYSRANYPITEDLEFSGNKLQRYFNRLSQQYPEVMTLGKLFAEDKNIGSSEESQIEGYIAKCESKNQNLAEELDEGIILAAQSFDQQVSSDSNETPVITARSSASIPTLGEAGFFNDVLAQMALSGKNYYTGSYTHSEYVVMKAEDFDMTTWTTTTTNHTVDNAIAANPNHTVLLNGAMFSGKRAFTTLGKIFSNGTELPTSISAAYPDGLKVANSRFWFGQNVDNSITANAGSAASFKYGGKGHPPVPASPGANDLHSATGGLVSFIWPDSSGNRQKVTAKEDLDLTMFRGMKGRMLGFGIIGVDRDTGLIIIMSKKNSKFALLNINDVQTDMWNSGVDQAAVSDGGSSVALSVKSSIKIRAQRHSGNQGKQNTVTNYIVFTEK